MANIPDCPLLLAWGVVAVVVVLLCGDAETRDYLIGRARVLNVVSLGMLMLVLTITVISLSITY